MGPRIHCHLSCLIDRGLKTCLYQNSIPTLRKPSRISKFGVQIIETVNKALQVSSPIFVIKPSNSLSVSHVAALVSKKILYTGKDTREEPHMIQMIDEGLYGVVVD